MTDIKFRDKAVEFYGVESIRLAQEPGNKHWACNFLTNRGNISFSNSLWSMK
jgi:hypothetical protein